jgi:alpha-tubulin suppressor-like RCC1 family protein
MGSTFGPIVPVASDLASKIVRISTGTNLCLLLEDQSVYCAAQNGAGIYPPFAQVFPPGSAVQISDGNTYWTQTLDVLCVLAPDGKVRCLGGNTWGELGNGKPDSVFSPTQITGLTATDVLASQSGTFALSGTTPYVWGNTAAVGGSDMSPLPTSVASAVSNVSSIYFGEWSFGAYVIGGMNVTRLFENGSAQANAGLVPLSAKGYVRAVTGPEWDMGLTTDGQVEMFAYTDGAGDWGALGNGSLSTPSPASNTLGAVGEYTGIAASPEITPGGAHACAFGTTHIDCWGSNASGELGNGGGPSPVASPTTVSFGESITVSDVCVGSAHTCAVVTRASIGEPELDCWGNNAFSQLGVDGETVLNPTRVVGVPSTPTNVACYENSTCVWSSVDGSVGCFGDNTLGQLGNGDESVVSSETVLTPVGIGPIAKLSMGLQHVCVIQKSDSSVWCWGSNFEGAVGTKQMGWYDTPQVVQNLP